MTNPPSSAGGPEPRRERPGDAAAGWPEEALRGVQGHLEENVRAWIAELIEATTALRQGIGAHTNESVL